MADEISNVIHRMGERAPLGSSNAYTKRAEERSGAFRIDTVKNIEHIPGVEHLIAYLEPTGNEAFTVGTYIENGKTRTAEEIRKHAQSLRQRVGQAPLQESITLSLPKNIYPSAKEQTSGRPLEIFNHNIWAWEPTLLDDLERAKQKQDPSAISELRALIRSGSWDSHFRASEKESLELAKRWQNTLEKQPTDTQLEFTAIMNPDLEQVESLVALLSSKAPQCGPLAENAAEFLEEKLREAWLHFNALYRDTESAFKREARTYRDYFKQYPLEWPHSKFHIDIPTSVNGPDSDHTYDFTELHDAQQRIIELRTLRDQVYYHVLYPNLCSFIKT